MKRPFADPGDIGVPESLIKYKGHQVAPGELEEILLGHPAVADALVAGHPDPVAGELPKAFVVLDGCVPLADITRHVAATVAPHKQIRLIERVREIPHSATGKPQRPPATRVLITGGARGLGLEFAAALAAAGAAVMIVGRDRAALDNAVEKIRGDGGRVESTVVDVTAAASVAAGVAAAKTAFGGLDVLVNNAGLAGPLGPTWCVDQEDWWRTVETNLRGPESAARAVLPDMIAERHGRIVNIVSRAGVRGWPYVSAYAVSKAALIAFTENLARELRDTGVTAVAFDPGLVDAGITADHLQRGHTGDMWADKILDWIVRTRDAGGFTSLSESTTALVSIATGAADHLSGHYVTTSDDLGGPAATRAR